MVSIAICTLTNANVPELLGEAPESAGTLAEKAGINPDALRRLLRVLAGYGIFREESPGRFAHTAQSRVLRADHPHSLRGLFRMMTFDAKLLELLPETLRSGRPASALLAPGGIFEYLATHPEEARIFDEGMTSKAHGDVAWLLGTYDFSKFSTIADIGGGRGHLIRAILAAAPSARGILFDLPQVTGATSQSDRLTIQAGDFFRDRLPACDAYLLMNVIHDWPDAEASKIFKAVRQAAPSHAKLLLIEVLLPEKSELGELGAFSPVILDARMLYWTGGRERTLSQYENLLGQAGFSVSRVIPSDEHLSVMECIPRG
jgi:hypothetical protein